jgi:simple sugar transport system permease protein
MGYDSISVALLGSGSPIGSIFAAAVVSVFQQGANYMSSSLGVAKEIASLITGILLLFASCGNYMKYLAARTMQKTTEIASQGPSRTAPVNQESKEAKTK